MSCLADIKYLTHKKVINMQPIYYVKRGISGFTKPCIIKLEGERLKNAIDNEYLLYSKDRCFTMVEEALNLVEKAE